MGIKVGSVSNGGFATFVSNRTESEGAWRSTVSTDRPVGRVNRWVIRWFRDKCGGRLCGDRTLRQRLATSRSPDPLLPSPGSGEPRSGPWKLTGTSTVLGLDWLSPPVDPVLEAAGLPPFQRGNPGPPRASGRAWSAPQPGRSAVPRRPGAPFLLEPKGNEWGRGTGGKTGRPGGSGHAPAHSS